MAVIYFDLDGTLTYWDKEFSEMFEEGLGFEVDQEVHDYWTEQLLSNIRGLEKEPYRDAMEKVVERFDFGVDPEKAAERRKDIELESTEIHEGVKQLLQKLSEKHRIGVLTNGSEEVQKRKIKKFGLKSLVDEIIVSIPEGVRKPDKEIFEVAKDRLEGEEYIYIGDNLEGDIKPAKTAGFKTIYIRGEGESEFEAKSPSCLSEILVSILE
jgi:putative hydrolase of the HAD superfamily